MKFTNAQAPTSSLGRDIRAVRKSRGLTLGALASDLGRSVGWLSQVERDISAPTITDLKDIARHLDVPLSLFFGAAATDPVEAGRIVRADQRREIGERQHGLVETLLSPDLTDNFEVVHSTFLPGGVNEDPIFRETAELVVLVSGKLDLWLDETLFTLNAGDSARIRGQSYRWANPYAEPAIAIWIISPPTY